MLATNNGSPSTQMMPNKLNRNRKKNLLLLKFIGLFDLKDFCIITHNYYYVLLIWILYYCVIIIIILQIILIDDLNYFGGFPLLLFVHVILANNMPMPAAIIIIEYFNFAFFFNVS